MRHLFLLALLMLSSCSDWDSFSTDFQVNLPNESDSDVGDGDGPIEVPCYCR